MKKSHVPRLGLEKNQWAVTSYFALSLFAIMGCEYVATLKGDLLLGGGSGHLVYAAHSIAVAAGVLLFYLAARAVKAPGPRRRLFVAALVAAGPLVLLLAMAASPGVLWASVIGLFLLAGANTGLVSYYLYGLYQSGAPVGRALALASFAGLTAHYLLCRLLAGSPQLFGAFAVALVAALAGMLLLLAHRMPGAWPEEAPSGEPAGPPDKKYRATLVATALSIVLISFVIGLSDSLVAQGLPGHVHRDAFFYPVLFYIPGQVAACLLVDLHGGRYVNLATLAAAILLMPVTFFLESAEELYLNAGFNFFLGGFFLVYIMTGIISMAHHAKNPLGAVCLPGLLYPLFCGVGGLLSPLVARSMDLIVIITVYSAMIVVLAVLTFISLLRRPGLPEPEKSALSELLARFHFTEREVEVLMLLMQGLSSADIAARLFISEKTVRNHVSNMLAKTGCSSRVELIMLAKG